MSQRIRAAAIALIAATVAATALAQRRPASPVPSSTSAAATAAIVAEAQTVLNTVALAFALAALLPSIASAHADAVFSAIANARVPESSDSALLAQRRDSGQRQLPIDHTVRALSAVPVAPWSAVVFAVGLAAVCWRAVRFRSLPATR